MAHRLRTTALIHFSQDRQPKSSVLDDHGHITLFKTALFLHERNLAPITTRASISNPDFVFYIPATFNPNMQYTVPSIIGA